MTKEDEPAPIGLHLLHGGAPLEAQDVVRVTPGRKEGTGAHKIQQPRPTVPGRRQLICIGYEIKTVSGTE